MLLFIKKYGGVLYLNVINFSLAINMDLFDFDQQFNLLPYDGEVFYFNSIIKKSDSEIFFNRLLNTVAWEQDKLFIYGKNIVTKRKVAWYGDKSCRYTYSNNTKTALPWTITLSEIKTIVEQQTQTYFNSCLLNLYHCGDEGMAWHSDDEKELGDKPIIASVSLGTERKFAFKHKQTKESVSHILEQGSLLLMKGDTQQYWQHSLPKTTKVIHPRINLTFRKIISN